MPRNSVASESDAEMRSYAEAELETLRARHEQEGEVLRDMLYDQAAGTGHAALIFEIRAGTGSGEAALFSHATSTKFTGDSPSG